MSEAIERIFDGSTIIAIIVRASLPKQGMNFVSKNEDSLQLGVNHYKAGAVIKAHYHIHQERNIKDTAEMLHIDYGHCDLDLYDNNSVKIKSTTLSTGDTVIFLEGGHGLVVNADTRIVEIKQGPYNGPDKDKKLIQ
jgi:cupin fold WbuC family metalloprotein